MISVLDVTYHSHTLWTDPEKVLEAHKPAIDFAPYLRSDIKFIKHLNFEGRIIKNNILYSFYKRKNSFWYIPLKTHRYIKSSSPDIILIQGFIYPLQVLFLRFMIGKRSRIIIQHHGERPFSGIKKWFQKWACKSSDAFLFTTKENADQWIDSNILSPDSRIYELLEASTNFSVSSKKQELRKELNISGEYNFLWVGRLISGKDPLTALIAFSVFCKINPEARLYMIFQQNDLISEVNSFINENELGSKVKLVGYKPHEDLEQWFNAADFYISTSHKEACGYTMLEAMACGCIPIVTNIPSYRKITKNGKFGKLFNPGDPSSLLKQMRSLNGLDRKSFSKAISEYFKENLSFKKIASDLDQICLSLVNE
jgi:glycosyltransferase involved in cell wall biosynthesis